MRGASAGYLLMYLPSIRGFAGSCADPPVPMKSIAGFPLQENESQHVSTTATLILIPQMENIYGLLGPVHTWCPSTIIAGH